MKSGPALPVHGLRTRLRRRSMDSGLGWVVHPIRASMRFAGEGCGFRIDRLAVCGFGLAYARRGYVVKSRRFADKSRRYADKGRRFVDKDRRFADKSRRYTDKGRGYVVKGR